MARAKEVNFIDFNGNVITSILLDDNFKNEVNNLLQTYKGANEDYIKLIHNNIVLNSEDIFYISDNFIISDKIDNIQVIKSYKKHVYFEEHNNKYILNDAYNIDKYYMLLYYIKSSRIINFDYYYYITTTNYYDIITAIIRNNGRALQYASDNMKDNYDIVLAAVKNYGDALKYASKNMKDNYDIVLAAVQNNGNVLPLSLIHI